MNLYLLVIIIGLSNPDKKAPQNKMSIVYKSLKDCETMASKIRELGPNYTAQCEVKKD